MGIHTCSGATLKCTFGMAPGTLIVLPLNRVMTESKPAANIMDNKPMMNIMPFGMCQSLANPTVAAATSAAMGVLTPMPCIPNTVVPWTPGNPMVLLGGQPSINNSSKLACMWAGVISIIVPGQTSTMV